MTRTADLVHDSPCRRACCPWRCCWCCPASCCTWSTWSSPCATWSPRPASPPPRTLTCRTLGTWASPPAWRASRSRLWTNIQDILYVHNIKLSCLYCVFVLRLKMGYCYWNDEIRTAQVKYESMFISRTPSWGRSRLLVSLAARHFSLLALALTSRLLLSIMKRHGGGIPRLELSTALDTNTFPSMCSLTPGHFNLTEQNAH
mgnify:CR=1 FL=1